MSITHDANLSVAYDANFFCAGRIKTSRAVYTVVLSPNATLLAFGGESGAQVVETSTQNLIETPAIFPPIYGAVTTIHWAHRPSQLCDMVFLGTHYGYLIVWSVDREAKVRTLFDGFKLNGGREVMSVASHSEGSMVYVVVAQAHGVISKHEFNDTSMSTGVWAKNIYPAIPRAVTFAANKFDVIVFEYHRGMMFVIHGTGDTVLSTKAMAEEIRWATVDHSRNEVIIDHGAGFSLHKLDSGAAISCFSIDDLEDSESRGVPRQTAFVEKGAKIVVGSADGNVYIFDRVGGYPKMSLPHARGGCVETLTAHDDGIRSIIVTATSLHHGDSGIAIWVRSPGRTQTGRQSSRARSPTDRQSSRARSPAVAESEDDDDENSQEGMSRPVQIQTFSRSRLLSGVWDVMANWLWMLVLAWAILRFHERVLQWMTGDDQLIARAEHWVGSHLEQGIDNVLGNVGL